jgi:hypothetical protein
VEAGGRSKIPKDKKKKKKKQNPDSSLSDSDSSFPLGGGSSFQEQETSGVTGRKCKATDSLSEETQPC